MDKKINFSESYASLLLGIVVVVVVAVFFIMFIKNRQPQQTTTAKPETISQELGKIKQEDRQYTVVAGDTLWSIAEKQYNSGFAWPEIAKANKITIPEALPAGTKLVLPKVSEQILATNTVSFSISGNSYTVKEGDYLWDIAIRAYGDAYKWSEIARTNNLENPNLIYPGDVFKLPR